MHLRSRIVHCRRSLAQTGTGASPPPPPAPPCSAGRCSRRIASLPVVHHHHHLQRTARCTVLQSATHAATRTPIAAVHLRVPQVPRTPQAQRTPQAPQAQRTRRTPRDPRGGGHAAWSPRAALRSSRDGRRVWRGTRGASARRRPPRRRRSPAATATDAPTRDSGATGPRASDCPGRSPARRRRAGTRRSSRRRAVGGSSRPA